jgi:hypothetical protein
MPIKADQEADMTDKTCAACDCELDANAIKVKIGGKSVEVCCDECAVKLREANADVDSPKKK